MQPDAAAVLRYLQTLQATIVSRLTVVDRSVALQQDDWQREAGGGGRSIALSGEQVFAKGGVNLSHVMGGKLPPSATAQRPQLAGAAFEAMGVSVVIHAVNPHVPTAHANVRFFMARPANSEPVWWFGGGFDLTPVYAYREDAVFWHQRAKAACDPFGADIYPRFKTECDEYFYLKHRKETRGVGGLFYDDYNQPGFDASFALTRSIGDTFIEAYIPIVERRKDTLWGERERAFQQYRRGRYVEFNLVYDRGTLFGLQSGGRTESILMSLPPLAEWRYNWQPQSGTPEAELTDTFLKPQDWLNLNQT